MLPRSHDSALQLAALVWRERWSGTMTLHLPSRQESISFCRGSLTRPARLRVLSAYSFAPAEFTSGKVAGSGCFRSALGELLVRTALRDAAPLRNGRARVMLVAEDAAALGLPPSVVQAATGGTLSWGPAEAFRAPELPSVLGALDLLGFLEHLPELGAKPQVSPASGGMLEEATELSEVLERLRLSSLEVFDISPAEQLLAQARGFAES